MENNTNKEVVAVEVKCNLKVILAKKDMQLKELAERTGLNYSYLSKVSNGRKQPEIRNILIIANALDEPVKKIWELK